MRAQIHRLKKIQLAVTGEYEDFSVRAAFSTTARAKKFIRDCLGGDGRINTYTLDGECGKVLRPAFKCWARRKNGAIVYQNTISIFAKPGIRTLPAEDRKESETVGFISFVSEAHARKLAAAYFKKRKKDRKK